MKKLFKSKILLAILAVAVVASTIGAGTYSWFMSDGSAGTTGGTTATITASLFELTIGAGLEIDGPNDIDLVGVDKNAPTDSLPELGYNPDADYIYPGEGKLYTIDTSALATLTNNRAVVVKLDFENLISETFGITGNTFGELEKLEDIYFKTNMDELAIEGSGVLQIENAYYVYVPAGGTNFTDFIGEAIEVAFGIIGIERDQSEDYMGKTVTLLSDANVLDAIEVTVVQATPAAVKDVFKGAVTLDMDTGRIVAGISFDPPVIPPVID